MSSGTVNAFKLEVPPFLNKQEDNQKESQILRIFLFSDNNIAKTLKVDTKWELKDLFNKAYELFNENYDIARFKANGAILQNIDDLRENDEIELRKNVVNKSEAPKTPNTFKIALHSNFFKSNALELTEQQILSIQNVPSLSEKVKLDNDNQPSTGSFLSIIKYLLTQSSNNDLLDSFIFTYDLFVDNYTLLNELIFMFRLSLLNDSNSSSSDFVIPSPRTYKKISMTEPVLSIVQSNTQVPLRNYNEKRNQTRLIEIMKRQIELKYPFIHKDIEYLKLLDQFITFLMNTDDKKYSPLITTLIKALLSSRKHHSKVKRNLELCQPFRKYNTELNCKAILEVSPKALAQQLTLLEQDFFARIKPQELMYKHFNKQQRLRQDRVDQYIEQFNRNSYWIASIILKGTTESSLKKGANYINHIILTMEELLIMRNYNTMMQIFSALNMLPVQKLEKTWKLVSNKCKSILDGIEKLISSNYKLYRELEEKVEAPCIPLQDLIMRDLAFIFENPTHTMNSEINIDKLTLIGKIFKKFTKFQTAQYSFAPDKYICSLINSKICTEKELFELAKKAELMESNSNPNLITADKKSPRLEKSSPLTRSLSIGKKKGSKSEKKKGNRSPVRNAITIDQIINDDELYKKLHEFMKGALIEETLDFYKAVDNFKNNFNSDKKEEAIINLQTIYNSYISANSERPVSFSTNSFVEQNIRMIESFIYGNNEEEITKDIFDGLISDVMSVITYHINRWKSSE